MYGAQGDIAAQRAAQQSMGYGAAGANAGQQAAGMSNIYGGLGALQGQQGANIGQSLGQMSTNAQDVGAYMNPYIQNALNPALALQQQQFGQIGAQNQGAATQSGAFGGGREAVMAGLNQQNQMLAQNQLVGGAYSNAFTNAQQQMNAANQAALAGNQQALTGYGMGLQGANQAGAQAMQGYGMGLQGANQAGQLGIQGAQAGLQGVGAQQAGYGQAGQAGTNLANIGGQQLAAQQGVLSTQNAMGTQEQQNQQALLNQAIQNYGNQQNYGTTQATNIMNLLRSTPTTQTQTVYQAPPSQISQLAGLAGTTIAGAKLAGYKKGGITQAKKFDVGGSVEHDLYQMPTQYLTPEVKNTTSPTIRNTGSAILTQRRMGTEPEPGYAPGGIVAFAEGGSKGKREAYEGESEDDDLINNIMMSGMSQGMMPNYTQMRQAPSRTNTPSGSTFEKAMQFVLPHEASYVNHPNDKGGPTNRGVTQATLSEYLGRPATIDDVKNLDEQTARDIYKTKFFDPIASKLKDPKAQMVAFNAAIASGPEYANKLIAKHEGDPYAMWQEHTKYMTHDIPKANPSQNVFVKGWNNRQQDLLNAVKTNFADGGKVQHFDGTDKSEVKDDSLLKSDGSGRYANKQIAEDAARYEKIGNYLKSIPEIVNPISNLINTGKGIINWGQTPVQEQFKSNYPDLYAQKQLENASKNGMIPTKDTSNKDWEGSVGTINPYINDTPPPVEGPKKLTDADIAKLTPAVIKPTPSGIASVLKTPSSEAMGPPKELMDYNAPTTPSAPATDRYSELMDMLKGQHKDIAKQREQDKWMALLQGSLGTLAYTPKKGEAQTPFSGIGKGALEGLNAYAASNKQRAEENKDILGQMIGVEKVRSLDEYQKNHLLQSAMDRKATIDAQLQTANLSHLDRQDLLEERKRNDDIIAANQSSALQERMDARKDVNTRTARDDLRMMEDSYRRSLEKQYIDKNPLYHMDPKLKSSFDKDLQKLYEMPQYNDLRKQAYPNVDFSTPQIKTDNVMRFDNKGNPVK